MPEGSLTRPFAANVDIAIVRISNLSDSPAYLLPVEFVEHEGCRAVAKVVLAAASRPRVANQPVLHYPAFRNARMSFRRRLSPTRLAIGPIRLSWLIRAKTFSRSRSTHQLWPPAISGGDQYIGHHFELLHIIEARLAQKFHHFFHQTLGRRSPRGQGYRLQHLPTISAGYRDSYRLDASSSLNCAPPRLTGWN